MAFHHVCLCSIIALIIKWCTSGLIPYLSLCELSYYKHEGIDKLFHILISFPLVNSVEWSSWLVWQICFQISEKPFMVIVQVPFCSGHLKLQPNHYVLIICYLRMAEKKLVESGMKKFDASHFRIHALFFHNMYFHEFLKILLMMDLKIFFLYLHLFPHSISQWLLEVASFK